MDDSPTGQMSGDDHELKSSSAATGNDADNLRNGLSHKNAERAVDSRQQERLVRAAEVSTHMPASRRAE
jgi:hypothetical protein